MNPERRGWTPKVIQGGRDNSPEIEESAPVTEENTKAASVPIASRTMLLKDAMFAVHNIDRVADVPDRIDVITKFVFSLKGFVKNDSNIALRREGLATVPMSELVGHILNSTESEWAKHPSFYGAVLLEYHARVIWIQDNLLKEKE